MKLADRRTTARALLALSLHVALLPSWALACGAWVAGDASGWRYVMPEDAASYIAYENGIEKMIMSHKINASGSGVVGISPIPAAPELVKLDVLDELPHISGQELSEQARQSVAPVFCTLAATQLPAMAMPRSTLMQSCLLAGLVSLLAIAVLTVMGTRLRSGFSLAANSISTSIDGEPPDVVVHQHLEKHGLTSELLTARTAEGLYRYLQRLGLNIPEGAITSLNDYIGKEYSFVVSWVSPGTSAEEAGNRGVFATFPSPDIYYPLMPMRANGEHAHPESIVVMGHVSPHFYAGIQPYATVTYHQTTSRFNFSAADGFYHAPPGDAIPYTKIEINAPGSAFTRDLHVSPGAPLHSYYSSLIANYPLVYGLLLLIVSSLLAGLLAGLMVFRQERSAQDMVHFAAVGLMNCFTLFGVWVATASWPAEQRTPYRGIFFGAFLIVSALLCLLVYCTV